MTRSTFIITIFLLITFFAEAQSSAIEYLNRAPKIPVSVCGNQAAEREKFENAVETLSGLIETDAQRRARILEENAEQNEDVMKNNIMKQSGITESEMKKLESKEGMSDAEQKAMVDRMLQQQAGITLNDAQNLQNMNKQQQEAWGTQYAAGQVDNAKKNPNSTAAKNQNSRDMYELLAEQHGLAEKISEMENQLRQRYSDLIKKQDAAKSTLENDLKPLYTELNSINDGEGSTRADVAHAEDVIRRIHIKQDAFCEKHSPDILKFLADCRNSFEGMLPSYDRMEEIQNEVTAMQTGVPFPPESAGRLAILAVDQYLGYLKEAYRNKLYRPEP